MKLELFVGWVELLVGVGPVGHDAVDAVVLPFPYSSLSTWWGLSA